MITKDYWLALLKRAAWTFCQAALSYIGVIGVSAGITDVDWIQCLNVAALAALISALKSIVAGMPECKEDQK